MADDAPTIVDMHRALAEYCEYPAYQFNISENQVRATIESPSGYEAYYVADDEYYEGCREIGGFIYTSRSPLSWNGNRGVYVEDLYVRPDLRGGYGVGTSLLGCAAARAIEFAEGNSDRAFLRLDTANRNNDATLRFYEGKGFDGGNTNLRLSGVALKELAQQGIFE